MAKSSDSDNEQDLKPSQPMRENPVVALHWSGRVVVVVQARVTTLDLKQNVEPEQGRR